MLSLPLLYPPIAPPACSPLQVAISMACRLRFCRRLEAGLEAEGPTSPAQSLVSTMDHLDLDSLLK